MPSPSLDNVADNQGQTDAVPVTVCHQRRHHTDADMQVPEVPTEKAVETAEPDATTLTEQCLRRSTHTRHPPLRY